MQRMIGTIPAWYENPMQVSLVYFFFFLLARRGVVKA